ncbi:MAG: hypothetical protein ICV82_00255 [Nitrososphaera sp.]|nr:hypothetical protein [Nitrososphaera sp.]MBD0339356.1 hypothetical protein [Microcoleus sp. Co-bin12]
MRRWQHQKYAHPVARLARESEMTVEQVWAQLGKEREYLLNQESKLTPMPNPYARTLCYGYS